MGPTKLKQSGGSREGGADESRRPAGYLCCVARRDPLPSNPTAPSAALLLPTQPEPAWKQGAAGPCIVGHAGKGAQSLR